MRNAQRDLSRSQLIDDKGALLAPVAHKLYFIRSDAPALAATPIDNFTKTLIAPLGIVEIGNCFIEH